jgi:hypothetical protein
MHVISVVVSKAKQADRYYTDQLGSQEVSHKGQVNQVNAYIMNQIQEIENMMHQMYSIQ